MLEIRNKVDVKIFKTITPVNFVYLNLLVSEMSSYVLICLNEIGYNELYIPTSLISLIKNNAGAQLVLLCG